MREWKNINQTVKLKVITDRVAARYRLNKAVSAEYCRAFMREIGNELAQGNTVQLLGLGTIFTTKQDANPDKVVFGNRTIKDKFKYRFVPAKAIINRGREFIEVNKK